jgi:hypothetical protein
MWADNTAKLDEQRPQLAMPTGFIRTNTASEINASIAANLRGGKACTKELTELRHPTQGMQAMPNCSCDHLKIVLTHTRNMPCCQRVVRAQGLFFLAVAKALCQ